MSRIPCFCRFCSVNEKTKLASIVFLAVISVPGVGDNSHSTPMHGEKKNHYEPSCLAYIVELSISQGEAFPTNLREVQATEDDISYGSDEVENEAWSDDSDEENDQ